MIKIVICDDEVSAAKKISERVNSVLMQERFLDIDIDILVTANPKELLMCGQDSNIDILLLDIMMPECDGIQVAETFYLHSPETLIIFTSGYENMVFYTLKFRPFRFVRKSHLHNDLREAVESALDDRISSSKRIIVKADGENIAIIVSKIEYVLKRGNYLILSYDGNEYRWRSSVTEQEPFLKYHRIIRINSGILINVRFIARIIRSNVILKSGKTFPISQRYQKKIESSFLDYIRRDTY
ncbi:MAG: response regulator transcription factor [Clostridia bacterium]|nr:response regulator transcription factor [Clostridia bacterium]